MEYADGMRSSRLFKDGTVSIGTGEWLDHKVTAAVMEFTLKEWLDVTNLAQRFPNSICSSITNPRLRTSGPVLEGWYRGAGFEDRPPITEFGGRPRGPALDVCNRGLVSRSKLRGQGKQI